MSRDKKPWSQFEDDSLKSIIHTQKVIHWCEVAKHMKQNFGIINRSSKQCRDRWNNHLDPNTRKCNWTIQENEYIFDFQHHYGNRWSELAKYLIGRSENTIKNHFYATVRRKIRKYNRIYDNKITKKLNEVINDTQLMKILRNIPEKPKKTPNFQLRRSSRLSAKAKLKYSDVEVKEILMKVEVQQMEKKEYFDKEHEEIIVIYDKNENNSMISDRENGGNANPYDVLDLADYNMNNSKTFFQQKNESLSALQETSLRNQISNIGNRTEQDNIKLSDRVVLKCNCNKKYMQKFVMNTAFQC
ncbi:hypothetical protein SteCoe_19484 [Stentor coeruleus]|uniref:Myb-like domain-containing protein n=1 Tax=Stentor coeruleus TaxID=5963 RepID=A0A1R2BTZ6_9CILI|nr:hypothetical protein SteCoe_19484 [Stentor coeruleus]